MCHTETSVGSEPVIGTVGCEINIPLPTGQPIPAFLASPEKGQSRGGVVVIHDMYGVSPFYRNLTARVAAAGYNAFLPNLFFRQGPLATRTREEAVERRTRFDEVQALDDLEAAADHLVRDHPDLRLASMGFCMGGTFALDLAARRPEIRAISYYGFPLPKITSKVRAAPAPLELVDRLKGPILGLWGDKDETVGLENVKKLDQQLTSRAIEHEFYIYPGVGHGFMAASRFDSEHQAYKAAEEAWAKTVNFLERHLS